MTNLITRNYIFMIMVALSVISLFINKHAISVIYFIFVIVTIIYMLMHRVKFIFNQSIAILLLIVLWSFISSTWAVNPIKGVGISFNLLVFIIGFQSIYWLSKYTKISGNTNNDNENKMKLAIKLSEIITKHGNKMILYIAYAMILTNIIIIIDGMLSGKISLFLFHKPTYYKNQYWYEGLQTLATGLSGSVAIILYKTKKYRLLFATMFITFASVITNLFYTGYAGILIGIFAMIVVLVFPRKIALCIFIISITLYYLLFPTFFGILYDSSMMEKISAYSPGSLLDRYVIWEYSHLLIAKNWLFGYGADASKYIHQVMDHNLVRPGSHGTNNGDGMIGFTPHPHNLSSQIWIEYGLFGILAYCLFLVTILKRIFSKTLPKYARMLLMMSFIMIMSCQNIAWGMWESWFIISICMSLGLGNFIIGYLESEYKHKEQYKDLNKNGI